MGAASNRIQVSRNASTLTQSPSNCPDSVRTEPSSRSRKASQRTLATRTMRPRTTSVPCSLSASPSFSSALGPEPSLRRTSASHKGRRSTVARNVSPSRSTQNEADAACAEALWASAACGAETTTAHPVDP